MRRFFIYLIMGTLAIAAIRAMHHRHARPTPPQGWQYAGHPYGGPRGRSLVADELRHAEQAVAEARRAMHEAGREARHAWREARDEMGRAYRDAKSELREAYHEVLAEVDGRRPPAPVPPPPTAPEDMVATEQADDLPVRIVPGTRVTQAEVRPPIASGREDQVRLTAHGGPQPAGSAIAAQAQNHREVTGEICATEDRARADARRALQVKVSEWLEPEVPSGTRGRALGPDGRPIGASRTAWTPPARLLESMIVGTKIEPYISPKLEDEGPLYIATVAADFSPRRRAALVDAYSRELVRHRLLTLGGSLGFVLICLAAVSGYIRADEATKGYYTNRLRLLAAAGVGAAGVIVFKMIA